MRKLLAFLAAGIAVGVALGRLLGRRRRTRLPATEAEDPRAEALRAQLAASREDAPSATQGTTEPAEAGDDVDEARRRIHERGRAAVERMRRAQHDA